MQRFKAALKKSRSLKKSSIKDDKLVVTETADARSQPKIITQRGWGNDEDLIRDLHPVSISHHNLDRQNLLARSASNLDTSNSKPRGPVWAEQKDSRPTLPDRSPSPILPSPPQSGSPDLQQSSPLDLGDYWRAHAEPLEERSLMLQRAKKPRHTRSVSFGGLRQTIVETSQVKGRRRPHLETRNAMVRHYRDQLNEAFQELSTLTPSNRKSGTSKLDILQAAVGWTRDISWALQLKLERQSKLTEFIRQLGGLNSVPDPPESARELAIDLDIQDFYEKDAASDPGIADEPQRHWRRASEPLQGSKYYNDDRKSTKLRPERHVRKISSHGSIISVVASVHSVTSVTYRSPIGKIETENYHENTNISYFPDQAQAAGADVSSSISLVSEDSVNLRPLRISGGDREPKSESVSDNRLNALTSPQNRGSSSVHSSRAASVSPQTSRVPETSQSADPIEIQPHSELPQGEQKPIRFKDAIGRNFSVPWQLASTWTVRDSCLPS